MSVSEGGSASVLPAGVTVISFRQLYSPGQVALATLLGGPLGGAWLLARNYQRLDAPRKARAALAVGVLAMAVTVAIFLLVHPLAVVFLLMFPPIVANALAERLQGADHVRHSPVGGRTGLTWRAVGLGVALIPIYLAPILGGAILRLPDAAPLAGIATGPAVVRVGINRVYYTQDVAREEAKRVGEGLIGLVPESANDAWSIEVMRDAGRPVVACIVQDGPSIAPEVEAAYHQLAEGLSRAVYGGAPIDIWLVDPGFRPRLKLRWESRPRSGDSR